MDDGSNKSTCSSAGSRPRKPENLLKNNLYKYLVSYENIALKFRSVLSAVQTFTNGYVFHYANVFPSLCTLSLAGVQITEKTLQNVSLIRKQK